MIYILRNKEIMRRCVQYITSLYGEYQIEIKPYKKGRSSQSNKYYWGVVLKVFGDFMGEEPEDLHELFKLRFLGTVERNVMGSTLQVAKSTTSLTTKEFNDYIDKIRATAIEMGCHIPDPSEFGLNGDAAKPSLSPPDTQRIPAHFEN